MKNKYIWIISTLVIVFLIIWVISGNEDEVPVIRVEVSQGDFELIVKTTGELKARHSEDIFGPRNLNQVNIWQIKITDIVPEGTIVKEGDKIAELDKTELANRHQEITTELEKINSQFTQTKLDTMLELRGLRNELINLEFGLEERKIALEQSRFEPPAIIRQAEIDLDKAKRAFEQAQINYQIRQEQARARMIEVTSNLSQQRRRLEQLEELMKQLVIRAPKGGMVIYIRERGGSRRGVGSTISTWAPSVATLPDLSEMISRTYVNEVDISRVRVGQNTLIGIDAFPGMRFPGEVISVANVGEQLPFSDAKVYEVEILLKETDTLLRPAMTTSNNIITSSFKEVLFIPLEAIHHNDTMSYVIKNQGRQLILQEVIAGESNENEIIIKKGLEKGDLVHLTIPSNILKLPVKTLLHDETTEVEENKISERETEN